MNKKIIGGIVVVLIAIAYFVSQAPQEETADKTTNEVKLAVVLGFTGPAESLAESWHVAPNLL